MKLEKIESKLQLFDIVYINTADENGKFTYVGKGYFRWHKDRKSAKLVITGCYVKDHADFLKGCGADLIIGNEKKKDIPGMTDDILELVKNDMEEISRERICENKIGLH